MRSLNQAAAESRVAGRRQGVHWLPDGSYLTDGKALFRVERTILDSPQGELFVELEDCATLELIFCSAQSIVELELCVVQPARRQLATA
jgi:hypothetical protein